MIENLSELLRNAAATHPHQVAVVAGPVSLTYRQLEAQADELAGWLRTQGLQPGDRVGLCLPKTAAALTALYGVLKAGGVYVPADVRSPPARLAGLLADAGCRLILTTPRVAEALPAHWPADTVLPALLGCPQPGAGLSPAAEPASVETMLECSPAADAPAALLYTSGSTGRSKGVILTHRNILCFAEWGRNHFALQPADRVASIAPFHFDLSTFDLFATHRAGGTVVLLDEQAVMFPSAVVATFRKQQITVCYAVPTTWVQLLERGGLEADPPLSLRQVLFAGEVFPLPLLRRLMHALPRATFTNLYGPVETNVCTFHTLPGIPAGDATEIPIGHPLPHSPVEVLDDQFQSVPAGEVGQLCVWGPGVSPGYWGQPGLTEQSRVGGRADTYQTGDLGFRDAAGTLWFRGRRDHQVKIRGHRIELGEVEAALGSHPGVAQAVAVVHSREGELQIVAFVQPRDGTVTEADLHPHLAGKLSLYARPHRIIVKLALPTTDSGKIDRQTLISWAAAD